MTLFFEFLGFLEKFLEFFRFCEVNFGFYQFLTRFFFEFTPISGNVSRALDKGVPVWVALIFFTLNFPTSKTLLKYLNKFHWIL